MPNHIRDFIDLPDHQSLDALLERLTAVRQQLPYGAIDLRVHMRGDDVFGRKLTVSFLRPRTPTELALARNYSTALWQAA